MLDAIRPRLAKIAPRLCDELDQAVSDLEKTARKSKPERPNRGKQKK